MAGKEGVPDWRPGDGSSTASGGHQRPSAGSGPLFEALDAPLPSEVEKRRQAESTSTTQSYGESPSTSEMRRSPSAPRRDDAPSGVRRRGRIAPRRVKRKLQHIDPLSILKISLIYYTIFLIVWLAMVAVFYSFIEGLGFFDLLDDVGEGFAVWDNVNITLGLVEKWAFIIGLTFVVLGSLLNLLLAFLYNVISDLVGGIEVTFLERDA